ncbi:MAG: hypothetical protein V4565_05505 [Bacteroidota bacterium]
MKLSDIFRKKSAKKTSNQPTKIDKKKLSQLIGGLDVVTSYEAGAGAKGTKRDPIY